MGVFDGLFGSLISAGGNLLGGVIGGNNAKDTAAKNIAEQEAFAQHGLTWKAQDATNAETTTGINRLALLGVPTNSFSSIVGDNSLGAGVAASGQDLGRAANALTSQETKAAQLEEKLVQAKIANVNADTVSKMAVASTVAVRHGQPGTVSVPVPREDPRGPVIPLMQRARDPRTGEIVWIPSEKASSPLQTLAASPTNAALAGKGLTEGMFGLNGTAARSVYNGWQPSGNAPPVGQMVD